MSVHHLLAAALVLVFLALAGPGVADAEPVTEAAENRLDQAMEGGVEAVDFHHLQAISQAAHGFEDWHTYQRMLERLLASSPADPLVADVLRTMRAEALLASGDPDRARQLFDEAGGLTRWWVHGPAPIEELADFDQTRNPPEAGWRFAPGTDPTGWVALHGLGWPARRQLLVLATTVSVPREQPAALHLGAAQVARVWVNGEAVLTTDHPLRAAEDQAAAGAWLRAGENTVAVAVASESEDWWLRLRITAPDGSPLPGLAEVDRPPRSRTPVERVRPDIRTMESELRAAAEAGRHGAALSLAAWMVHRSPAPAGSGAAREACRAARDEDEALARVLEWMVTPDPAGQRDLLEQAVSLGADPLPARVELAAWYAERGLYEDSARILRPVAAAPAIRTQSLVADVDLWGEAVLPALAKHARNHPNCLEALLSLAEVADRLDRPAERDWAVARARALAPGHPHLRALQIEVAQRCGDGGALAGLVEADLANDPNQPQARITAARLALAEGRGEAARSWLADGLERSPSDVDLRLELASLEHRLGRDREAVAAARSVLETRPQEERAERLLELLGAHEVDSSWAVAPDELWALAEAADHLEGPAVVLLDHTQVRLLPGNLTEERFQRVFLVRDAQRSESLEVHRLPYVRERQRMQVLAARVLGRDGSVRSAVQHDTPRLAEPEFNLYYDTRLRVLRFDRLRDGDLVEITYTLTETAESNDTGAYHGGLIRLGAAAPVLETVVALSAAPGGLPNWELGNLAGEPERTSGAELVTLRWRWRDLEALPPDVPDPPDLLVRPHLVYSNHPEWGDLADWYARHIAPRIRVTPAVESKARELTDGAMSRAERIARIYRFVADRIRYVGLEFGEHRYRPFSADWVLDHRIGDCKDKASLLVALLEASGIPARMVMIRTSDLGPVATDTALLESFNHAIAYLPEDDLWLDGTASGHEVGPPPGMDQQAWALVVDGRSSHPVTTPATGAGVFRTEYILARTAEGPFEVTVRTADEGEAATIRRGRFAGSRNPLRFARWLQSEFPGAELVGDPTYDLSPGRRRAEMQIEGRIDPSALVGSGALRTYPGPFDLVAELAPTDTRTTPLVAPVRPDLEWSVEIRPPREGADVPGDDVLETRFGQVRVEWSRTEQGLRLEGRFELEPGLVPADEFAAFREFLVSARQILDRPVEVPR